MKKVLCKAFIVVLFFVPIFAQADVGGNFQLLQGEGNFGKTGTLEYVWSEGKFSGYGFYDRIENGPTQYFTEHAMYYSLSEHFYLAGEVTKSAFGDVQKVGAGVNLTDFLIPSLPVDFFTVRYYAKAWGAREEQVEIVWQSKKFMLSDSIGFYMSGFANILDDGPNFTQPQAWFTFGSSKFEIGFEFEQFGNTKNTSFAFKYNL